MQPLQCCFVFCLFKNISDHINCIDSFPLAVWAVFVLQVWVFCRRPESLKVLCSILAVPWTVLSWTEISDAIPGIYCSNSTSLEDHCIKYCDYHADHLPHPLYCSSFSRLLYFLSFSCSFLILLSLSTATATAATSIIMAFLLCLSTITNHVWLASHHQFVRLCPEVPKDPPLGGIPFWPWDFQVILSTDDPLYAIHLAMVFCVCPAC